MRSSVDGIGGVLSGASEVEGKNREKDGTRYGMITGKGNGEGSSSISRSHIFLS